MHPRKHHTNLDKRAPSRKATYLRDQHPVPRRDAHGQPVALLVEQARADGQDLGLVELLDARLGQEDAAGGLGLGLDALHEHAVEERHEGADGADRGGLWGVLLLVAVLSIIASWRLARNGRVASGNSPL